MRRTLIVGWDSADWSVVDPMLKAGEPPNLARIIKKGVKGPLESTFNPNSFPGWTSFMTGVNPGKHGILHPVIVKGNSYAPAPVNSGDIRVRTMWDHLSDAGVDQVVINVPVTYPPMSLRGVLISSILTPSLEHQWTYPEELGGEILREVGGYIIDARHDWRKKKETMSETEECIRLRKETALHLMRSRPWGVFCVVFTSLDRIQHCFWGDRDPDHPGHNPADAKEFGDAFERAYRMLDVALGELVGEAGPETDIIMVSDHGTGPLHYNFRVNLLLMEEGLLVMKREPASKALLNRLTSRASTLVADVIEKLKDQPASVEEGMGTFADKREAHHQGMKKFAQLVDWERTTAFFSSEMGIRLNLRGREPEGSVEPAKRGATIDRVVEALMKRKDPISGGPLFKDIVRREDIYSGPMTQNAPDIFPVFASPNVRPVKNLEPPSLMSPERSGAGFHFHHFRQGILVAGGPSIRAGKVEGARLMDIAPTVLHLSGQGVPAYMDGEVLKIFSKTSEAGGRRPRRTDAPEERVGGSGAASPDDEDIITERLKGLGYI